MNEAKLVAIIIVIIGVMTCFISAAVILHRTNKKRKSCTGKVMGTVIKYVSNGNAPMPVVEYNVDGQDYIKTRYYRAIITKFSTFHGKGAFDMDYEISVDDRNVCHIKRNPNFYMNLSTVGDKLWPIGSPMEVFYDPNKPKRAYVGMVETAKPLMSKVMVWSGSSILVVGGLIAFITIVGH